MTTNYHTPISTGAAANSSVVNSPLAQLDAELTDQGARITVVEGDIPVPSGVVTEYYDGSGGFSVPAGTGAGVDGHLVQDEGVDLPQRAALNFVGAGVTVTNETGGTQVDIPGGGHVIQDEGVDQTQRAKINFTGAGVAVVDTAGATEVQIFSDGWMSDTSTWSYSSADAPTFMISVNADMTAKISVGMRIKLTQTTAKYFIVTAVGTYGSGVTLITVYGGTDYTLANAAITSPCYSGEKTPFGFNANPEKWSVIITDVLNRSQSSPTNSTWYNLSALSISVPIGTWSIQWKAFLELVATLTSTQLVGLQGTLSTSSSTTLIRDLDYQFTSSFSAIAVTMRFLAISSYKNISVGTKTTYYLLAQLNTPADAATSLAIRGDYKDTYIKAVCAYL